jgi:hypothetical protein
MKEISSEMKEISSLDYEQFGLTREQFDLGQAQLDAGQTPWRTPCETGHGREGGFLSRHFGQDATRRQKIFDVVVGIILPVLCLYFDPIVFRGGIGDAPMLGRFRLFAYAVVAVEIAALALWLAAGERIKEWGGMLGGAMLAGAIFSFVVGVLILPYSILGLLFLIGVLGFSPFFCAFVYLRNAARSLKVSSAYLGASRRAAALALGAAVSICAPAYAHLRIERAVARGLPELMSGDEARAAAAARRLRFASWLGATDFDDLARAYEFETDAARKERLARAYQALTGRNVEDRLSVLHD